MKKDVTRYAVVDLEATGTGAMAKIIQVGIVLMDGEDLVSTYETLVNPHEKLDDHIKQLTGLTDRQLAKAPTFSQVAETIYNLIGDRVFVAHNVQFDANLLAEQLFFEGFELRNPRVDTVELAQVCFPTLERYNLSALSQQLGLELGLAHQALDDALATARLLTQINQKLRRLPRQTLASLVRLGNHLIYETGMVLEAALATKPAIEFGNWEQLGELCIRAEQFNRSSLPVPERFDRAIEALGLVKRAEQAEFAARVSAGYETAVPSFLEGRAGLGKTYGYLLPILAKGDQRQVVVAVPTKLLQDQVMNQEGQALAQVYQTRFASLKSPRNYLDLERFARSLHHLDGNRQLNRYKMRLLVWLLETQTGDLDELQQKQGMTAYLEQLGHSGRVSGTSPYYTGDFWRRAQRRVQESQVVVTNHAFLLATLKEQPTALSHKVLVVDEAQRFFLAMEASSRRSVSLTQVLLDISHQLAKELPLLTRRLLENLQHQLNDLTRPAYRQRGASLPEDRHRALCQDLAELPAEMLPELRAVVEGPYADFWLDTKLLDGRRQTELTGASLDFLRFSDYLQEGTKAYFISATIQISKRVSLPQLLGIEAYEMERLDHSSVAQQMIWIDDTMPEPDHHDELAYLQEVAERVMSLATLGLPILVLSTSIASVVQLSELLRADQLGHLAQGIDGSASQVKRRFDKGEQAVLLGTGSFWEGADFASQERLVIVVTKLPFDNPKDPFVKKVNRHLSSQGKQPFYDYTLPLAGLKLKQALGRGSRQSHQQSAVVILDGRLTSKPYAASLKRTLADLAPLRTEKMSQILSEIQDFCYNEEV